MLGPADLDLAARQARIEALLKTIAESMWTSGAPGLQFPAWLAQGYLAC
jgi:hypothetical protein